MTRHLQLPKPRKGAWFVPVRWSYIPCSWQGWLLYVPFVYFLVITFVVIDGNSHSVSDAMIAIMPYWVSATVVMHWIAYHKS